MAGMGASISGRQVERIREWKAKTIVLFFDADRAGWDAAKKIGKELKGHCVVKIVKDYADCKDPAEIVEKGKAGLVLKSSNISVFI